ncbi:MAG: sirohydrochlorin chelatase [Planctomycetaceae bacterium]
MNFPQRVGGAASLDAAAADFEPGDGVLLIGHGTRDRVGTEQFFQLAELLAERLSPLPVEPCLLELQRPTIEEGWQRLHARGVRRVLASPLLLFAAGHARSDIPSALDRCLVRWPGMTWREARPLSRTPELLRLALQRLDESLAQASAAQAAEQIAVLMVGRGSFDPCAQADMKLLTHWLAGQRRGHSFFTAFYAMAQPSLSSTLERLKDNHSFRSIVVQPHLLFEGNLYQSILQQTQQIAAQHHDKEFIVSNYLGPEPEVVDALVRRLRCLMLDRQAPAMPGR